MLVPGPPTVAPETDERSALVQVTELSCRRRDVELLRGISLRVEAGSIHALLGVPGAGTTVLLHALCGLVELAGGAARIAGRKVGADPAARDAVGFVPAGDGGLYRGLSGSENLLFFARLHGLARPAARSRVEQLLALVGLPEVGSRLVETYTPAMRKRLAFARALVGAPRVLLLDELTHGLQADDACFMRRLAAEQAQAGAAIVWASGDAGALHGFCDRVSVLQDGEVHFEGSLAALSAYVRGKQHVLRIGHARGLDLELVTEALAGIAVLGPAPDRDGSHLILTLCPGVALGSAIAVMAAAGVEVIACREERSRIDSAFLSLVGRSF